MRLALLALFALIPACSGPDPAESRERSCSNSDRYGTYLMEFTTVSGDCGEQTSSLTRLDGTADLGTCTRTAPDGWSDADCTLERSLVCPADTIIPGGTVDSVGITTQQDNSGDLITGTITMRLLDAGGQTVCFGTYSVSAVRQ